MIDEKVLQSFQDRFDQEASNHAVKHSIAKVGLQDASIDSQVRIKHPFVFSHETHHGKITNQESTGRCWMFAALNTARVSTMTKMNIENFEFSQNYTLFWDKLERCNYVLDCIIETVEEPRDSRLIWHLLQMPIQDGGQWEMFAGILRKYGAVPKEVMPETYHSSNTRGLNMVLTTKIREYAARLRQSHADGATKEDLIAQKDEMLYFIYNVLVKALGSVPYEFDYRWRDRENEYHVLSQITPQQFFQEYVDMDLDDLVSLINAPTEDKPYGKTYSVKYLASIAEANPIKYLNVPIEVLKQAAIQSIKEGHPVWFGCDVGKMSDRDWGIMDADLFKYEDTLGEGFTMSKEERLDYSVSMLTHAMVFVGVDLDEAGNPINWKVENSWGKDAGHEGFYSMSDEWFDQYNFQITVPKRYIDPEYLTDYDEESILLDPWDPMGALAYWQ